MEIGLQRRLCLMIDCLTQPPGSVFHAAVHTESVPDMMVEIKK